MACGCGNNGKCPNGCGGGSSQCTIDGLGFAGTGGQSPVRQQKLLSRLSTAASGEFVIGKEVNLSLQSIPLTDEKGRHAHVAAIRIVAYPQFDITAASLPAAVTGYDMLGLINVIFIEDSTGWKFVAGEDARSMRDDMAVRNYKLFVPDPAGIPDADATNLVVKTQWYWPFSLHDDHGPTVPGPIPLALLRAKGNDAIRFRLATTLPGAPAGVVYDGYVGDSFARIYVDLLYLPNIDYQRWQVEQYTLQETDGVLRHCDRWHEYAVIRYFGQDTGGQDVSDFTGFLVQSPGGKTLIDGLNSASDELLDNNAMWIQSDPDADLTLFQNVNSTESTFVIMTGQHRKAVPASPYGAITYKLANRATHTLMRFLHRTIGTIDAPAVDTIKRDACLPGYKPVARIKPHLVADGLSFPGISIRMIPAGSPNADVAKNDVLI